MKAEYPNKMMTAAGKGPAQKMRDAMAKQALRKEKSNRENADGDTNEHRVGDSPGSLYLSK